MWPKNLKSMPSVKSVMTPFPHFIDLRDSLARAREMMVAHGIHHLPVMDKGKPVAVISHRDVLRALNGSDQEDTSRLRVADAPRHDVYVVDLSERLDRVLVHMAERRLEAALVAKEGRLAGIFTLTDACRCFAESLHRQFPPRGGDEAA